MKILIIYGTSEGHTRKIARYMEEVLQNEGHTVVIADASEQPPSPLDHDMVLIGASLHMHKYQSSVRQFIMEHLAALNALPSAFFSVCLSVASEIKEEHAEAHKIAADFLAETGWHARETGHIAGALKYTRYDYFKRLIMRMIAKKQGASTNTLKDHEYTDWDEVGRFVLDFVKACKH